MQNSYSLPNTFIIQLENLTANAVSLSHTKHCSLHGNLALHEKYLAVFAASRALMALLHGRARHCSSSLASLLVSVLSQCRSTFGQSGWGQQGEPPMSGYASE